MEAKPATVEFEGDRSNERQLTGEWLLRLEWLEGYVAYRVVIDTNNLAILYTAY